MDLLVGLEAAGQSKSLPTRQAHISLLLRVDASVIAQCHRVRELLGAERTAKIPGLMGILVVQETSSMTVAAITYVAFKGPLFFSWIRLINAF